MKTVEPTVTHSTGNVFRDVGFSREESAHLLVRADLLIQLQKTLESRVRAPRHRDHLFHAIVITHSTAS